MRKVYVTELQPIDLFVLRQQVPNLGTIEYDNLTKAWSLFHQDRLVACCGYQEILPHIAEVWMVLTPFGKSCIATPRVIRTLLEEEAFSKYERVQAMIALDVQEDRRFIRHMGFYFEGILRRAGVNGEDMIIAARIQEE